MRRPRRENFVRLVPGEATEVAIDCRVIAKDDGVVLWGEHNIGDYWTTKPLTSGVWYLKCTYHYPDSVSVMMNKAPANVPTYEGNKFPWKDCIEGTWHTKPLTVTIKR
ncbi:MAG: hypothetical protein LBK60_12640 [Verrucomicrobiales bacterium]|nr:hypothetical protein [Verrucomicrobiales bacterium]